MGHVLGVAITVTLWVWGFAESGLQLRGFLMRGRTATSERRTLLAIVVLMTGGIWTSVAIGECLPGLSYSTHGAVLRATVLVVAWAGITVRLWAIVSLGKFFRGTVHVQEDHEVVRHGPYRRVRHPAYSGLVLAVLALTIMQGNVLTWVLYALCTFIAVAYRVRVEERVLTRALGTAYTEYAAQTRRLIPGVW